MFEFRGEDEQLITISPGAAREALNNAGMSGFDVSDFTWEVFEDGQPKTAHGLLIRTPEYGALEDARAEAVLDAFLEKFTGRDILSAQWSGDRLFVRSKQAFDEAAVKEFFSSQDLEMKDWGEQGERFRTAEAGTDEVHRAVCHSRHRSPVRADPRRGHRRRRDRHSSLWRRAPKRVTGCATMASRRCSTRWR